MKKGIISRLIINEILISLKRELTTFDYIFEKIIKKQNLSFSDKKLIQNVVFCCMRNFLSINKIIKLYVKKMRDGSCPYKVIEETPIQNSWYTQYLNSMGFSYKYIKNEEEEKELSFPPEIIIGSFDCT